MANFTIDLNDSEGLTDAVNSLLSGPSGLGQGFDSFNSNGLSQFDLTGNFRRPYTQLNFGDAHVPRVNLYVAPIALGTSEMLDQQTWKYTFAVPQVGDSPFVPGQNITVSGVDNDYYDGRFTTIGVVECTNEYVIARTGGKFDIVSPSTGGTVELDNMDRLTSTDCVARATVSGNQQSVIISSQLNIELFADPGSTGSYYYKVYINRYKAVSNNDVTNPDFVFIEDNEPGRPPFTLAYQEYLIPVTDTINTHEQETIFTSIIDQPGVGYYQYFLEVEFNDNSGGNIVTNAILTQRSFSATVFKP
jgi:hypothetical protein